MNNEHLLQLAKHLGVHCGLKSEFESAYSMDGLQILPPLMTEIKRLEMQQLRLRALAIEMSLKRNKSTIGEKKMKCLMPRMVNASTNTVLPPNPNPNPNPAIISHPSPSSGPAPLVVMGRFRQELQKSKTAVYDHSTNELTTFAPPKTLPLLVSSHVVIEDAPQRAVITPVRLGTIKSSWVSCEPQQCSTTTIDLRVLNDQERLPGRPVVLPSSSQISQTSQGVFRSQIPTRSIRLAVQPKIQPPQPSMIAPGHAYCHKPSPVKTDTANERRRNYGAKVTMMRNELTKKREELAKLKPPPKIINKQVIKSIRTPIRQGEGREFMRPEIQQEGSTMTNNNYQVPKSIRTPIRRGEGGEFLESEIQQQGSTMTNNIQVIKSIRTPIRRVEDTKMLQNPFQSVISRQELDQQSLQGTDIHQQGSLEKPVKITRTPIIRVEAEELPVSEIQQQGSTMTNINQGIKGIRIPIRRVEGVEFPGSQLQQQRNRFKSLFSRHEHEQQRLQAQQEQQQQGLIDQMLGHPEPSGGQDTASEFLVDQDQ